MKGSGMSMLLFILLGIVAIVGVVIVGVIVAIVAFSQGKDDRRQ